MLSSIFNSKTLERYVPHREWIRMGAFSFGICIILTCGWEMLWRSRGYAPSLNDDKDLWAIARERIDKKSDNMTIIGSSRSLFGFNLKEWEKELGEMPVQLSTVATNPNYYLDHLANESEFNGLLIIDVVPSIFFAPEGTPVDLPTQNIKHYKHFTPAQRWSHYIGRPFDEHLAFLEQDDLTLKHLLSNMILQNRKDAVIPPPTPPYFHFTDRNRQGSMINRALTDQAFADSIKKMWIPYYTRPAPPPGVSLEQQMQWFSAHIQKTLNRARANIQKIKHRGGRVVFVRYPSTGNVKVLEDKYTPREFWNTIIRFAGPDYQIHYEDFEELRGFDCPEESHLSPEDAVRFTRGLIQVIKKRPNLL